MGIFTDSYGEITTSDIQNVAARTGFFYLYHFKELADVWECSFHPMTEENGNKPFVGKTAAEAMELAYGEECRRKSL